MENRTFLSNISQFLSSVSHFLSDISQLHSNISQQLESWIAVIYAESNSDTRHRKSFLNLSNFLIKNNFVLFAIKIQISSCPGKGNCTAKASILSFNSLIAPLCCSNWIFQSANLGPETLWMSKARFQAWWINSTTVNIWLGLTFLVVKGGVPNLIPDGFMADLSPGTVFLLTEIPTSSKIRSALDPDNFLGDRSTNTIKKNQF